MSEKTETSRASTAPQRTSRRRRPSRPARRGPETAREPAARVSTPAAWAFVLGAVLGAPPARSALRPSDSGI